MKEFLKIMAIPVVITLFVTALILATIYHWSKKEETQIILQVQKAIEQAYFEGQKDMLQGDQRIKLITDGKDTCYVWTKNC